MAVGYGVKEVIARMRSFRLGPDSHVVKPVDIQVQVRTLLSKNMVDIKVRDDPFTDHLSHEAWEASIGPGRCLVTTAGSRGVE